jgi:hypothetical protein
LETAIAIVDATADFFMATKRVVFVSLVYFMLALGLLVPWVIGEMSLVALNKFEDPLEPGSQEKRTIWGGLS